MVWDGQRTPFETKWLFLFDSRSLGNRCEKGWMMIPLITPAARRKTWTKLLDFVLMLVANWTFQGNLGLKIFENHWTRVLVWKKKTLRKKKGTSRKKREHTQNTIFEPNLTPKSRFVESYFSHFSSRRIFSQICRGIKRSWQMHMLASLATSQGISVKGGRWIGWSG